MLTKFGGNLWDWIGWQLQHHHLIIWMKWQWQIQSFIKVLQYFYPWLLSCNLMLLQAGSMFWQWCYMKMIRSPSKQTTWNTFQLVLSKPILLWSFRYFWKGLCRTCNVVTVSFLLRLHLSFNQCILLFSFQSS